MATKNRVSFICHYQLPCILEVLLGAVALKCMPRMVIYVTMYMVTEGLIRFLILRTHNSHD